jgi:hypothetical protein
MRLSEAGNRRIDGPLVGEDWQRHAENRARREERKGQVRLLAVTTLCGRGSPGTVLLCTGKSVRVKASHGLSHQRLVM